MLIALMLVTLLDVLGRYFLSSPLHGGHVYVQILVAALVFLGLPLLVRDNEFIKVALVDNRMSARTRRTRDRLVAIAVFLFLTLLTCQLIWQSIYFAENGEYFESIRVPVSWVAIFASILSTVAAGFSLRRCISTWQEPVVPE
ncbi:MAG: TRAP transporter small permease [Woeseiaceae bacterium]